MLPFVFACIFAGVAVVLAVVLCFAYVLHYADRNRRSSFGNFAAICSLSVGVCCVVLVPIDVFSVSSSIWATHDTGSSSSSLSDASLDQEAPIPVSFIRYTLCGLHHQHRRPSKKTNKTSMVGDWRSAQQCCTAS